MRADYSDPPETLPGMSYEQPEDYIKRPGSARTLRARTPRSYSVPDPTLRTCDYGPCDEQFPRGGRKRYCSRAHKERARDLRAAGVRPPCAWCGGELHDDDHGARRAHPGCAWARNRQIIALQHVSLDDRPLPLDLRLRLVGEHVRNAEVAVYLRHLKYRDPCAYCGQPSESLDHIDPEDGRERRTERGALRAAVHNLTGACISCNSTKNETPLLLHLLADRVRADLDPLARELGRIIGGEEVASVELRPRAGRLKLRRVPQPNRAPEGRVNGKERNAGRARGVLSREYQTVGGR